MTTLNTEFHGVVHSPAGIIIAISFAIAAVTSVLLFVSFDPMGLKTAETAPVIEGLVCASDAVGCELKWMQENLTNIEQPVLILKPGSH